MKYTVLKINTTGLNPEIDKITEIAILNCDGENVVSEFSTVINPAIDIPEDIEKIVGITNSMVKSLPIFEQEKEKIILELKDKVLVGFNIGFDLAFLKNALGIEELPNKNIDVLRVSNLAISPKQIKNYRFQTLCDYFQIVDDYHVRALRYAHMVHSLFEKLIPEIEKKRDELKNNNNGK